MYFFGSEGANNTATSALVTLDKGRGFSQSEMQYSSLGMGIYTYIDYIHRISKMSILFPIK